MATSANDIGTALDQLKSALQSGNLAQFQEQIRQFNLKYANDVGTLYGQNFGPGVPAPTNASTLAAGQATGAVGYIPGYTGLGSQQTSAELAGQSGTAQNAAGLTGYYAAPSQSQYSPGTFLRIDPSTYDYATHGEQLDYVTSSGQLQRVTVPQAQAMGYNGTVSATIPFSTAATLEAAPPSQLPQQTLQGLTTYSNLNTAAQNNAIAQSQATGYYTAPSTIYAPGTNSGGQSFYDLPRDTQMAYYYSNGGDWSAAMNKWVADSNAAAQQAYAAAGGQGQTPAAGAAGQPQMTQSMQQQQYAQGTGLVQLISSLQANPFQQQAALGQLKNLLGNRGVAGFADTGTAAGAGTGGTGYLQQMLDDIRSGGAANQASTQSILDAIPTPTKLDSVNFFKAPTSTQNMVLSGMQSKYGLDPQDSLNMIKNTLPGFQAPATYGTVKRAA